MRKIIPSMVFTEDNKERCASVEQIVQCRKSSQNRIVICACALSTTSLCACADGSCRKIRSSQCACRGQKVHSIPLNCVLTREFLFKTKCLLVASWTVKIAPVLESSFSGFLQDLIRLKKIDDIRVCKLLNGQTGTIQFGKVGKIFTDSTFPDQ